MAAALARGRAQFNAMVAGMKQQQSSFDTPAFSAFLGECVDPLAQAVAAIDPTHVEPVVTTAFEMGMALVAQSLAGPGARVAAVNRVWKEVAPRVAKLVAEQPAEVLGSLSNAVVNLDRAVGDRANWWVDCLIALGPYAATVQDLLGLGQVLAWRAGMVHYREGALDAADRISPQLALAAIGTDSIRSWVDVREQFKRDRWWSPDPVTNARAAKGFEAGAFTGFGGMFSLPPEIRAGADGFWIRSANRYAFLAADVHGAILQAATQEEFENAPQSDLEPGPPPLPTNEGLKTNGRLIAVPFPAKDLAVARNRHSIAIASPYSYSVLVIPKP